MSKVSAEKIKAAVAAYWRYTRQCPLVALEANCRLQSFSDGGQADVLVVTKERYLMEVEVKISMEDLRRDHEKRKHLSFRYGLPKYPTRHFYFAVPKELANRVILVCDQLYPYAGVLGCNGIDDIDIYRHPKALWGKKLTFPQILHMVREQSATLCRLARDLAETKALLRVKSEVNDGIDVSH